ncbi:MAG: FAD-binding oxidoreductase [Acidimicrobiales bacterium]
MSSRTAGGRPNPVPLGGDLEAVVDHLATSKVVVGSELLDELASCCPVDVDLDSRLEHSRDWWPLSLHWALKGEVPARPAAVCRPANTEAVASVLRACGRAGVPVTAAGGRSGVCGGAIPVFGGIVLDTCALSGITEVDDTSLLVDAGAGTLGSDLEAELARSHGLSVGHLPQSIDLATGGGWLACRGAGQYSTRYGKIEDIVAGLEVVLADGTILRTGAMAGAGPRSAMGPDLTQLFVGSEGTLGIITAARLRAHPLPAFKRGLAFAFPEFLAGLEAIRCCLRRGATPAVLRLYDETESKRNFHAEKSNLLVALDEGDEHLVQATMSILAQQCEAAGAEQAGEGPLRTWLDERNDVSGLAGLTKARIVVDTIEVSAPWSSLPRLYAEAVAGISELEGSIAASAHQSHAYRDGACLYFTFAGRRPEGGPDGFEESFYHQAWKAVMDATVRGGGSISHHHGIGLVRGGYLRAALGEGHEVLSSLKRALDPKDLLNPGKLALSSRFGSVELLVPPDGRQSQQGQQR